MTSAGFIGPGLGRAALRSYDAYAAAEDLDLEVIFGEVPEQLFRPSVLVRDHRAVLIDQQLLEAERHDELTHQLAHFRRPPRPGQSLQVLEEVVRSDAARLLIPVPALVCAVTMVIAADHDSCDLATAIAGLLGSQVSTIQDRLVSLTDSESASAARLLHLVRWPPRSPVEHCYCVQEQGAMSWLDRIRRFMHPRHPH